MDEQIAHEIERYLFKKMSAKERKSFEARMAKDPKLKDEVKFYKSLEETVVRKKVIQEVAAELEASGFFGEQVPGAEPSSRVLERPSARVFTLRRAVAYAAGIALLIVGAALIWANTQYSNQAIASLEFDEVSVKTDFNRNNADPVANLSEGADLIKKGAFADARTYYSQIGEGSPNYAAATLYLGFIAFKTGDYPGAITFGESVLAIPSNDTLLKQKAEWLVVQSKVAGGDSSAAVEADLNRIANDELHQFQRDAQILAGKYNHFLRNLVF